MKKLTISVFFLLINFNCIITKNKYLLLVTFITNIFLLLFYLKIIKNCKLNRNITYFLIINYILNQSLYIFYNFFKDYKISAVISSLVFITTYYLIFKFKNKNKYYLLLLPFLLLNFIFIFMSLKYLI